MTQIRLTKEQQHQLVTKIQELNISSPGTVLEVFGKAVKELNLPLKASHATGYKYFQKAGLKQPTAAKQEGEPSTNLPPEVAILQFEKGIQEQVRRLVARRDELAQQQLHLDNLISKYKAVR